MYVSSLNVLQGPSSLILYVSVSSPPHSVVNMCMLNMCFTWSLQVHVFFSHEGQDGTDSTSSLY